MEWWGGGEREAINLIQEAWPEVFSATDAMLSNSFEDGTWVKALTCNSHSVGLVLVKRGWVGVLCGSCSATDSPTAPAQLFGAQKEKTPVSLALWEERKGVSMQTERTTETHRRHCTSCVQLPFTDRKYKLVQGTLALLLRLGAGAGAPLSGPKVPQWPRGTCCNRSLGAPSRTMTMQQQAWCLAQRAQRAQSPRTRRGLCLPGSMASSPERQAPAGGLRLCFPSVRQGVRH